MLGSRYAGAGGWHAAREPLHTGSDVNQAHSGSSILPGTFPKFGVPYFGVLIIRILLSRVLY